MDDVLDFADDGEKMMVPTDAQLAEVARLAEMQLELEDRLAEAEASVVDRKRELDQIRLSLLPELMREIGIQRVDLKDGGRIEVKSYVGGSIKVEDRQKAHEWLRINGFGSLIKNIVSAKFGMGEEHRAEILLRVLSKEGYVVDHQESVHPSTLNAFVREQLEIIESSEIKLPLDLFGVFERKESKIIKKRRSYDQKEKR